MRLIVFLGDRIVFENFRLMRARAGFELREVQKGNDPTDWKPMKSIGPGVREIRIRASTGAFRVFYVLVTDDAVVVLHAFQKKTQLTPKRDIELAAGRFKSWSS